MGDEVINTEAGVVVFRLLGCHHVPHVRRCQRKNRVAGMFVEKVPETARDSLQRIGDHEDMVAFVVKLDARPLVETVGSTLQSLEKENKESLAEPIDFVAAVARGSVVQLRPESAPPFTSGRAWDAAHALLAHRWSSTPGQMIIDETLYGTLREGEQTGYANFDELPHERLQPRAWNVWKSPDYGVATGELPPPESAETAPRLGLSLDGEPPNLIASDLVRFDVYSGQSEPGEGVALMFRASFGREEARDLALKRVRIAVDGAGYAEKVRATGGSEALDRSDVHLRFTGEFREPFWDIDAADPANLMDRSVAVEAPPLARFPQAKENAEVVATISCFALDVERPSENWPEEGPISSNDRLALARERILKHLDVLEICKPKRTGEIVLGELRTRVVRQPGGGEA